MICESGWNKQSGRKEQRRGEEWGGGKVSGERRRKEERDATDPHELGRIQIHKPQRLEQDIPRGSDARAGRDGRGVAVELTKNARLATG